MGNKDFVKKLGYGKYDEIIEEQESEFEPANPDSTLETFFGDKHGWVDGFFDPEFNSEILDTESKKSYEEVIKFYNDKLQQSQKAVTYASNHEDEIGNDTISIPKGSLTVYPEQKSGLIFTKISDSTTEAESLRAVFPFINDGYEYNCSIQNVLLGYYDFDAQIEAFIDEDENLLLTFYDIHYLDNRNFYNTNDIFKFRLMGFVTGIEFVENDDMISLAKPEYLEGSKNEEYELHTIVRKIEEYSHNINDEKVWKLTVVLGFTPDGEDIPLDIFVTNRILGDESNIPNVGDNIFVNINIYGYLCGIEK